MANYQVSGSKILGPDGQPFVARGINIGGYLANNLPPASTDQITRMVDVCVQWGINTVRLVQNGGRRYSWSVANQGYKGKTGPEAAAVANVRVHRRVPGQGHRVHPRMPRLHHEPEH